MRTGGPRDGAPERKWLAADAACRSAQRSAKLLARPCRVAAPRRRDKQGRANQLQRGVGRPLGRPLAGRWRGGPVTWLERGSRCVVLGLDRSETALSESSRLLAELVVTALFARPAASVPAAFSLALRRSALLRHLAIVPRLYRRDGRRAFRRRGSPSRMRVGCACERGVRSVDGRAGAGQSMAALAESVMTPLAWKAGRVPGADARPRGLQAGVGTCQTNDGAVGGQPLYRLVDASARCRERREDDADARRRGPWADALEVRAR